MKIKTRELVIFKNTKIRLPRNRTAFRFGEKVDENCTKKQLQEVAVKKFTLFAQQGHISWDMIIDLKNGKRSDKMGLNTNYPQHSVFHMNNKIRAIRVKEIKEKE